MEKNNYDDYTEADYAIALEKVKKDYIGDIKPSEEPKLVFASGQPASGKSALPRKIIEDYKNIEFCIIDMDKFRKYHPNIKEIEISKDDFVQSTNAFSIRIEKDLLDYCLANKMNFIHISTIRIYEYFKEHVIDMAKKQKYNIEVYALAVPNLESKKSAILREEEQKQNGENIRKTSESFIDEADKGFKRSIYIMSKDMDISDIKILIRGKSVKESPIIVYSQKNNNGLKYKNAYDALIDIRNKQLKKSEN
mgnify:CR=1 FL=1